MRTLTSNNSLLNPSFVGAITVVLSGASHGAALYKTNNTGNLNLTGSWTDISGLQNTPASIGSSDALYFNEVNMQGDKSLLLGGNLTVGGLAVDYATTDLANNVTIGAGSTLTLNGTSLGGSGVAGTNYTGAGIVLNRGAGGSLTINSDVALGAAQQWVVGRNAGGLTVGGTVSLGANNLSLNVVGTGLSTISGQTSGSGKITKIGSGTLQVTGDNLASGGFQLGPDAGAANTGVVIAGHANALGSGGIISRGTQLRSSIAGLVIPNAVSVGAGGMRVGGTNDFTLSGTTTIDNSSRSIANYGTATVTLGNIALGGTASRAAFDVSGNIVVNGAISGTGHTTAATGAVLVAAGRVTFNGSNSYTGQTNVSGGVIAGSGTIPTLLAMSGGSFGLAGGGTTGGALTLSAGAAFTNAPSVVFTSAPVAATAYDVFNYAGSLTGLANLKSSVRGSFTDTGSKVTFTIGDQNQSRTWNPALATGNWDGTGTATNWLEGDTRFFNGDAATFNEPNAATTVTVSGTVNATGFTVNNTTNAYLFQTGVITGTTGFTKTGAGSVTLNSDHTYTGNVLISGGTVRRTGAAIPTANTNSAFGFKSSSRSITVENNATTLWLSDTTGSANTFGGLGTTLSQVPALIARDGGTIRTGKFNIIGGVTLQNGAHLTNSSTEGSASYGGFQFIGDITVSGTGAGSFIDSNGSTRPNHLMGTGSTTFAVSDVTGDATADLTVSTPIASGSGDVAGAGALIKSGAGTMLLSAVNPYTGTTTVSGGRLEVSGSMTGGGAISIANGTTLATSGAGVLGTGGTTLAAIQNEGSLVFGSSAAQSVGTGINGAGSVSKTGAGTLTLTSSHGYTGATTISGGTLLVNGNLDNSDVAVNSGGTLGGNGVLSGDVAVDGGTVLANSTGFPLEFGTLTFGTTGTVNVTAGLENYLAMPAVESNGDLTLNGAAGSVTVNLPTGPVVAGTYRLIGSTNTLANASKFALGTTPALGSRQSGALVANPGSLDYVVTGINPVWTGAFSGEWSTGTITAPKNWVTTAPTDYLQGDSVTFDGTATGTTAVTLNTVVTPSAVTFNFDDTHSYSVTGSGSINGSGSLTKSGTGTLTLGTTNGYSGGTVVTGGTIVVSSGATLGSGAITLNNGGLTLDGHTLANHIATTGGILGGTTFQVDGVISGTTLDINATGIVKFSGVNTYTGATNVVSGGLEVIGAGQLGAGNYAGAIANPALLRFDTTANQTLGGAISGAGQLVKNNTNTLTLGGTISYTGPTTVNAGTLVLATPAYVKVGTSGINVASGAVVRIDSANVLYTGASYTPVAVDGGTVNLNANHNHFGPLSLLNGATVRGIRATDSYNNEYSTFDSEVTVGGTAASTIAGDLTTVGYNLTNSTTGGFTVNPTGDALGADLIVSGRFTGGTLVKNGTGVMRLAGNNTYTGNTTINGGVLELAGGARMYNAGYTNTAIVTVNAGGTWRMPDCSYGGVGQLADYAQRRVIAGGTIEVTGNSHSSGQDFTVTSAGGTFRYTPAGQTLTHSGNGNSNIQLDGTLTYDAVGNITVEGASAILQGAGGITKTGAGTLTLGATNTYTGTTTVTAGTLAVKGTSLADAGNVVIDGGVMNLTGSETVATLYFGATQQAAGTWGASGSGAAHIDDTRFSGSGVLNVTSGPVVAGYSGWATTNAPGQTANDDYDFDGVANGVEYVLGGTKDANDSGKLPVVSAAGADLVFTFVRDHASKTPDTTVSIDVGTTLQAWPTSYPVANAPVAANPGVTVVDNGNGTDTVTLRVPKAPDAKKFAKLVVTIP
jgi:fibronectin-binding autotransporter adhesin